MEKIKTQIIDLKEHLKKNKISLLRLNKYKKDPIKIETDFFNRETSIEELEEHKGNFGIKTGFNHDAVGYSLAVADIDGIGEKGSKERQKVQQLIYEALKDIPNTMQVKTQSGGYHIYFFNKTQHDKKHDLSKSFYFPNDFEIEELRGKCLDSSIEIFTNFNRYIVLAGSTIKTSTGEIKTYEIINNVNKLSDIAIVDDIEEVVKRKLIEKGFIYNPADEVKPVQRLVNSYSDSENVKGRNKELSEDETEEIAKYVIKTLNHAHKINSKHYLCMAWSGIFAKYLSKQTVNSIISIIKEDSVVNLIDDFQLFKTTLFANYNNANNKAGIPTLKNIMANAGMLEFNVEELADDILKIVADKYEYLREGKGNNDGRTTPSLNRNEYGNLIKRLPHIIERAGHDLSEANKSLKDGEKEINKDAIVKTIIYDLAIAGIRLEDIEKIINYIGQDEKFKDFIPNDSEVIIYEYYKYKPTNASTFKDVKTWIGNKVNNIISEYAPVELKKLRQEVLDNKIPIRKIADYINKHLKVAINLYDDLPVIYNSKFNRYDNISYSDLYMKIIKEVLQIDNCLTINHIYDIVEFITDYIKPNADVIGLKNCNYDFIKHEKVEVFETPTLPLFTFNWDYNPNAKPSGIHNIIRFLGSSFKGKNEAETKRNVKGMLQIIGYILRPSNPRQIAINFVGIGGSGKGTLEKVIRRLVGNERVADVGIDTFDDQFSRAQLIGKYINIDSDASTNIIRKFSMFKKSISDSLPVSRKYKDDTTIPNVAVPLNLICSNGALKFEGENNLFGKMIVIEFIHKYRNTADVVLNYADIITESKEDMEWLLFHSLEALKEMDLNDEEFIYRLSDSETAEKLNKYADPVTHVLKDLIELAPNDETGYHVVIVEDLNHAILTKGEEENLEIPKTNGGKVKNLRNCILGLFDIPKSKMTATNEFGKAHYPLIKWKDGTRKYYTNIYSKK